MPTNRLPEDNQIRKTLEKLLIRLTWIEEFCEIALVTIFTALLWMYTPHILAWMWSITYIVSTIATAALGNDRWSQLRKDRR